MLPAAKEGEQNYVQFSCGGFKLYGSKKETDSGS